MFACFPDHRSLCGASLSIGCSLFISLLLSSPVFLLAGAAVLDTCTAATNCGPGLYCGNCPALHKTQPINGLPFNKYTWLVTHNAFSIVDAPPPFPGVQRLTFYDQEDSVTKQSQEKDGNGNSGPGVAIFENGVRGLMLDMYNFMGDIWLCHSFRGQCFNFTAFQPAINTLREVEAFWSQNPTEIVTIRVEDYVHTPKGLTKLFTNAGLDKYWFPVSKMPERGEDWPTVTEMVQKNHRLLVFTSVASKKTDQGIAYQWKYMLENEPGDPGVKAGSCPNRKESKALNSRSSSLFLMNYFSTYPTESEACKKHSTSLAQMVSTCHKAAGNVMPNFLAVNFYMRSDGGGVFYDLDWMNGQTLCGCSTVTACQAGAALGTCKDVPAPPSSSPVTNTAGSFSGSVQFARLLQQFILQLDWLASCSLFH